MPLIRPTTPADLTQLPLVERSAGAAFRSVPALAWVADDGVMSVAEHERLTAGGWCWVAVAQQTVHGFVCAERFGTQLHVWELAVLAETQGQGVGSSLMQQLVTQARRAAVATVTLTTFLDVPWNAPFYERLGFVQLDPPQLNERLRDCLAAEAAAGLPLEQRCAMQLEIACL